MTIWQSILRITFTTLSAIIAIVITVLIQKFLANRKKLNKFLTKYKGTVYVILLFLILSIPVAFSLPKGASLSPVVLTAWMRELLISIVIVVTFWVTLIVLDDPTAVKRGILIKLLHLLLKVWAEKPSANIHTTTQTHSTARYFFAKEYDQLKDLIGDHLLKASLKVCQIEIVPVKIGTNTYETICDTQLPFESGSVYIRHKGSGPSVLRIRYYNYDEGEEENTLRNGLRVRIRAE